jgi:hypothetical protein
MFSKGKQQPFDTFFGQDDFHRPHDENPRRQPRLLCGHARVENLDETGLF